VRQHHRGNPKNIGKPNSQYEPQIYNGAFILSNNFLKATEKRFTDSTAQLENQIVRTLFPDFQKLAL